MREVRRYGSSFDDESDDDGAESEQEALPRIGLGGGPSRWAPSVAPVANTPASAQRPTRVRRRDRFMALPQRLSDKITKLTKSLKK